MKLKFCKISIDRFESQTLKFKDLILKHFKHIRLSHKLEKNYFFITIPCQKIIQLKNKVLKLNFKI
jgi:hypothetical protein